MKRRQNAAVLGFLAMLAFGAAAQAQTADGGLSPGQLRALRALSAVIPIALPAYVPPGYRLTSFQHERDVVKNGLHSAPDNGYSLVYENAQHHRISILVADSGFGDVGPDPTAFRRAYTVTSALLGSVKMQPYANDDGHRWFSANYIPLNHIGSNPKALMTFATDGLSAAETQKVYQSLHVVH